MSRPPEFSEEELRALEAEMEKISVDDVLLQTVVSLVNLGARKAGLGGPEGPKPDLEQTRQAIEAARALLPLLEARHGDQLAQIREALSQLQLAYVRQTQEGGEGGAPPEGGGGREGEGGPGPGSGQPDNPSGAGPAQRSGRLWVPGQ
jgi:hypothetical protein